MCEILIKIQNKMADKNIKKTSEQNPKEVIKPLFEDMGNTHVHDEKSYNDLKNRNQKS